MDRLIRFQVRIADRRRDYLWKVVADLVARFARIAVEDLALRNFGRNLAIEDAGWGLFRRLLISKAEATGKVVALVEPRWTTRTCSSCGWRNRRDMPLSQRQFLCEKCGYPPTATSTRR
jgi:putative transposase